MTNEERDKLIEEAPIAAYIHYYIKDGELRRKFIPVDLKDSFLEKFGHDLLNADENEVEKFLLQKIVKNKKVI
jgi:hypothetical protein